MAEQVPTAPPDRVRACDSTVVVTGVAGHLVRDRDPESYGRWRRCPGTALAVHRTGDVLRIPAEVSPCGRAVIRKSYCYPTVRDRWRGVLRNTWLARSRVRRESEHLIELARRGLNPELFVACGEHRRFGVLLDSFLVTVDLAAPNLAQHLQGLAADERRRWLARLGEFVARLHDAGYVDRDLHLRNFLVLDPGRLAKIDCPRARFLAPTLHSFAVRRDLRELGEELAALGGRDALRVLHHYLRGRRGRLSRARCLAASRCRTGTSRVPR